MIRHFQATDSLATMTSALKDDGAIIIAHLLDEEVIDRFNGDLRDQFDSQGHLFQCYFNGYKTLRVGAVTKHSSEFPTLLAHPRILEIADVILKPHCEVCQIGSTTAIEILPGEVAQVLHADDTCYPSHLLPFEVQVSVLWALDDFTEDNGATRVVMRQDRPDDEADYDKAPTHKAVMPKGSVVIYLGSTVHGGGANNSDKPRKALVNTYCLGWLRQEENQYLALTHEEVSALPESVQRLLGYQAHGPNLGVWPDDPDGHWYLT